MNPKTTADQPKSIEEKAAEEVALLRPEKAPNGISEEEITAKVRAGLRRDQAIEVITRQREHDAALAKAEKAAKKAK